MNYSSEKYPVFVCRRSHKERTDSATNGMSYTVGQ